MGRVSEGEKTVEDGVRQRKECERGQGGKGRRAGQSKNIKPEESDSAEREREQ